MVFCCWKEKPPDEVVGVCPNALLGLENSPPVGAAAAPKAPVPDPKRGFASGAFCPNRPPPVAGEAAPNSPPC